MSRIQDVDTRVGALWSTLLVIAISGCGTRTDPLAPASDAAAVVDAVDADDASDAADVSDGHACPTQRPLWGVDCTGFAEQESCVYGGGCPSECVCERGSFVCSADLCAATCPAKPPANEPCKVSEINRVCDYGSPCVNICRCDPDGAGGARWYCKYTC